MKIYGERDGERRLTAADWLPCEQPLEPGDVWAREEVIRPDWQDPDIGALREFAEENYSEFIEYIEGYDRSLLFDFAMDNKMDFREFLGE